MTITEGGLEGEGEQGKEGGRRGHTADFSGDLHGIGFGHEGRVGEDAGEEE